MMTIRSVYNHGDPFPGLSFKNEPSLAKQSFEKESNINNLVAKYMKTGVFYDNPGTRQPQYGDFSEIGEYREIVERVQVARDHFASLPADVRLEYNNDVAEYLEAVASQQVTAGAEDSGLDDEEESLSDSEPPASPESPPDEA